MVRRDLEKPPIVITARVRTGLVKRILIDTGADSNIMFRNVFDALGLRDTDLTTHQHSVVGLGDHFIKPDGIISLPVSIGGEQGRRSIMAEFVVLRDSTAYIILGRKTINDVGAIISTKMLVMKFVTDSGSVGSIKGELETAVICDNTSLSLRKKSKEASGVFLADLDARVDDNPRPEPEGDLEKFRVGDTEEKFTFVNRNLPQELKEPLVEMIRANGDLFAWMPADMPSSLEPDQWLRGEGRFLVKKHNRRWRMCVNYSNLNKACPKDCYPLPNIDALVDAVVRYRYLSFMNDYSSYNQIPMHRPDEDKTTFITPKEIYSLKNVGTTYQRLMNKIFSDLIGKTVEVYVDNILAKTTRLDDLLGDLRNVFASL
nr:uncharacterized protein LOC112805725 [Arachis hypogaea]